MNYDRVIRYVLEMPWAIKPEALGVILDILEFRANGGKRTQDELDEILEDAERPEPSRQGRVAIIPIYGAIMPRADVFSDISGGASLQTIQRQLLEADRDDKVSDIVLDISSPGGSVELVPETAELIRNLKTPTVAVANTDAASAAYWLAAAADELVVSPSGEVGSIGVWTAHQDVSAMQEKMGVETTLISAGKYKVEDIPLARYRTRLGPNCSARSIITTTCLSRASHSVAEPLRPGCVMGSARVEWLWPPTRYRWVWPIG